MEFFSKGSEQQRHRFIDDTLAITREMLDDPVVHESLGSSAETFSSILDQFYVPNIVHGEIEVPQQHRHGQSIAILAVNKKEVLSARGVINELHHEQEQEFISFVNSYSPGGELEVDEQQDAIEHINSMLRRYKGRVSVPKNIAAQVMEADVPLTFFSMRDAVETKRTISGRPFTVLGMGGADTLYQRGLTVIHEMRHLVQTLSSTVRETPRFEEDPALEAELEAYETQSLVMTALYQQSLNKKFFHNYLLINPLAADIELIRREANKDEENPYQPSAAVKAGLARAGIKIVL